MSNKGRKLETAKATRCKAVIRLYASLLCIQARERVGGCCREYSTAQESAIPDKYLRQFLNISKNTYFKYKREVQEEPGVFEEAVKRFSTIPLFYIDNRPQYTQCNAACMADSWKEGRRLIYAAIGFDTELTGGGD